MNPCFIIIFYYYFFCRVQMLFLYLIGTDKTLLKMQNLTNLVVVTFCS